MLTLTATFGVTVMVTGVAVSEPHEPEVTVLLYRVVAVNAGGA
jgi:hypothetical protein